MKTINLMYNVPIEMTEAQASASDEFIIQGIAINSTVTDNQHKFLSEELQSAASSLINKPLLKDHDNKTDSVIGRVIGADYDSTTESVRFKARINKTEQGMKIRELIKSGDLNTVSIGANVTDMAEENGMMIPKGIKFKELSVVAVPADDGAQFTFRGDFTLALTEAYNKVKEADKIICEACKMSFDTQEAYNTHMKEKHPKASDEPQITEAITCPECGYKMAEMPKDGKCPKCGEDLMEESQSSSTEEKINKKEEGMEKDETIVESKNSFEEKFTAHTKLLEEALASFKELKEELKVVKEELTALKNKEVKTEEKVEAKVEEKAEVKQEAQPTVVETVPVAEIEEEADVNEQSKFKIVQGYKSFTIERKYR